MAEHDFTGVFNVAYGGKMTINHLAELIVEILGSKSKIVHLPERPGDVKHSTACVDKLLATGFQTVMGFQTRPGSHRKKLRPLRKSSCTITGRMISFSHENLLIFLL